MSVQPCGCGMTEEDWPVAHATLDPETQNGIKCGLDENGDTILWAYPTADVIGMTVATKAASAARPSSTTFNFGAMVEQAGAANFNGSDTFTAPLGGMWGYTVSGQPDVSTEFNVWFRMQSSFGPWGTPEQKTMVHTDLLFDGAITLTGVLPCANGGTLTFDGIHDRGSAVDFTEIYMAFWWICPLPT